MQTLERELKYIEPSKIDFDEHNPRGEKAESILKDPEFKDLVKSINTFGVLEPLIIKKDKHFEFEYTLIDGERRLRASKSIPLNEVPVIIAVSTTEGKILAYQLHMLRKVWSKIAEAKSIKGIAEDLRQHNPNITDREVIAKIKDFTNAPDDRVKELFFLTLYEDKHIEYVLHKHVSLSYLIETEKVLIPKIKKKFPTFRISDKEIRSSIVRKAKNNVLSNEARFLRRERNVTKIQFIDVLDDPKAKNILEEFFSDLKMTIADVIEKYNKLKSGEIPKSIITLNFTSDSNQDNSVEGNKPTTGSATSNNIPISTENKGNIVVHSKSATNPKQPEGDDYAKIVLTPQEQTTVKDIQKKFESKGKTFTEDEIKYIQEALKCLNNGCLKAATLMIWAASISRMLSFIEKNIVQFNTISKQMKDSDTSFYKVLSRNFQYQVKSIEEIRQASMDRQVLCYICYLNIIDITQFDKLKGYYTTRNNCAHPTKIQLKPNEIIGMFENIYEYIFDNPKLV